MAETKKQDENLEILERAEDETLPGLDIGLEGETEEMEPITEIEETIFDLLKSYSEEAERRRAKPLLTMEGKYNITFSYGSFFGQSPEEFETFCEMNTFWGAIKSPEDAMQKLQKMAMFNDIGIVLIKQRDKIVGGTLLISSTVPEIVEGTGDTAVAVISNFIIAEDERGKGFGELLADWVFDNITYLSGMIGVPIGTSIMLQADEQALGFWERVIKSQTECGEFIINSSPTVIYPLAQTVIDLEAEMVTITHATVCGFETGSVQKRDEKYFCLPDRNELTKQLGLMSELGDASVAYSISDKVSVVKYDQNFKQPEGSKIIGYSSRWDEIPEVFLQGKPHTHHDGGQTDTRFVLDSRQR